MATRRYSLNPGDSLENVTEAVGAAVVTKNIELTVNLAAVITDSGASRSILKEEVLIALNLFEQYIVRGNWLPA